MDVIGFIEFCLVRRDEVGCARFREEYARLGIRVIPCLVSGWNLTWDWRHI